MKLLQRDEDLLIEELLDQPLPVLQQLRGRIERLLQQQHQLAPWDRPAIPVRRPCGQMVLLDADLADVVGKRLVNRGLC